MKLKTTILSMSLMMPMPCVLAQTINGDITNQSDVVREELTEEENSQELEEITVTGSRIEGGAESVPITVITAEDIEIRGITSIDQLFRQFTSNSPNISSSNTAGINGARPTNRGRAFDNIGGGSVVNLRGLGAGSTLVLLNGRRLAGEGLARGDFADIAGIAINSIERVEILTSGASAIYGADAVAGVVNIIQKKNFTGLTATARLESSNTGASIQRYSLTSGHSWGSGNLTATITYADQKAVNARRFGLTTRDFRPRGGSDLRQISSPRGAFSLDPEFNDFSDTSDEFTRDVLLLPENSGPVDFATDTDSFERLSRGNLIERLPVTLSPASKSTSLSLRFNQEIDSKYINNVFIDAAYSDRSTDTEVERPQIAIAGVDLPFSEFGSPFDRDDIRFDLSLDEAVVAGIIPENGFETEGENLSFAAGFGGNLSPSWNWEASASYSENEDTDRSFFTTPEALLEPDFNFDTGELLRPAVNIIRNDFLTSPEAMQILRDSATRELDIGESSVLNVLALTRGELFSNRDSGPLQVSFGFEYREEDSDGTSIITDLVLGEFLEGDRNLDSTRKTTAVFSELSFPITERITLEAAARWEETRNQGRTTGVEEALAAFEANGRANQFDPIPGNFNFDESSSGLSPRLGAAWQLRDNLKLRASLGQSFRSPNPDEVGQPVIVMRGFSVPDPLTGEILDPELTPQVLGGNERLRNEIADTLNVGFEYGFDSALGSFDMGLDYYQIQYEDRIADSVEFLPSEFENIPLREPAVVRTDDGTARFIFDGPINVANEDVAGLDFSLNHIYEGNSFALSSNLTINQQLESERFSAGSDEVEDNLGIAQPETRANLVSTLIFGNFEITSSIQYNGSYLQRTFDDFGAEAVPTDIESFTTVDLQLSYLVPDGVKYFNGTRVRIGANNIFDTDPPFLDDFNGFDGLFYDLRRRVVYLELSKTF